ncbi:MULTISPECIES: family 43 glycosylhydrolase [Streptosporangium]|uniref:Arabinan endo-1,5-alpha-L-arabinosidase n=1 Tax=Streptosporangium brasiliense TaxID=47480 RepID=A0ABT9RE28_9ACTN|nr:family 43 glycosylhydrolase [Streptosporangium brasiliense]MDP9867096.1 arabinan endo-1,5-alpha-L-arabinosidase [Streptosporangium brasiliense]
MTALCAGLACLIAAAPAASSPREAASAALRQSASGGVPGAAPAERGSGGGTYTNQVSGGFADTFADPAIIRGEDGWWYAFGTSDPLREGERSAHHLPISRSRDLVSWSHVGDAFTARTLPTWADTAAGASLWAPDIRRVNGRYRLYYVVTQTTVTPERNDNAIGMATAPTPAGPWTDSGAPVVGPRRGGGPDDFKWTFDPSHAVDTDGTEYLVYGSYYGGIHITRLDATGGRAVGDPTMIAIDNRFEGGYLLRRGGYWYLFASSADCCAGPTTGYSVYAGRSRAITGPYLDREGMPLNTSRAGGTIVIAPNGNRWVGTGHNAVVTDPTGQDWLAYHAIDRDDPYLDEPFGINERPMLIDRLDWIGGWPTVRGGAWASEEPQRAPGVATRHRPVRDPRPGPLDRARSDEFDGGDLRQGWTWVRAPQGRLGGGALRWPTQAAELNREDNSASVLLREVPEGNWTAETKLRIDLGTDTVRNYQQAGLIAYGGDDLYAKLVHAAIWNTRQTEFGKEMPYAGRIAYGGTIVGPPADTTWLRLVHRVDPRNGEHELRAATSRDGKSWIFGGVWTMPAETDLRVGLISLGGAGATAEFDYFRLYRR